MSIPERISADDIARAGDLPETRGNIWEFPDVRTGRRTMTIRQAVVYWIIACAGLALAVLIMSSSVTALELRLSGPDGKESVVPALLFDLPSGMPVRYVSAADVAALAGGAAEYDPISRVVTIKIGPGSVRLLTGSARYVATQTSPSRSTVTGSFDEEVVLVSGAVFVSEKAAARILRLFSVPMEAFEQKAPATREYSAVWETPAMRGGSAGQEVSAVRGPEGQAVPSLPLENEPVRFPVQPKLAAFIKNIVIDAGHGALDAGAVGPGGTREKDVNLAVALALEKALAPRIHGAVHLTRKDDTFVSLPDRVTSSKRLEADLFISIHSNSAPGTNGKNASGAEVYFFSAPTDADAKRVEAMHGGSFDPKSEGIDPVLWNLMLVGNVIESHRLAKAVSTAFPEQASVPNRGVKSARFYVLHYGVVSNIPSILIELGFISNPEEEKKLRDPEWQAIAASAIADAICEFLADIETRYPNGEGWAL